MTFWEDLMEEVRDEPIEAVVIGDPGKSWTGVGEEDDPRFVPKEFLGVALHWEQAKSLLDYKYDKGYGGQDCHDVHIWTPTRVISIHEYDGATWPISVPRNPPQP